MAVTLRQEEAQPPEWPEVPEGLSDKAGALAPGPLWARIESHIVHRFSAREVIWTVDGPGDWSPPLTPATITLAERWTGTEWATTTLAPGPYGYTFGDACGPHRVTATVGDGPVPDAVAEAFRRLAEYVAASDADHPGVSDSSVNIGGALGETWKRNPAHVARALVNSGAADLLRPYRKVT